MSEKREGIYAYGVVRAGVTLNALEREGEGLPDVWLIEAGELAALASDLPDEEQAATRDHVLAHSRVLAAAAEDTAVVPLRFGMIFPSDEAIRDDLLEGRREELVQLLDKFADLVQMTLKVEYDEPAVLREIMAEVPEIAQLREEIGDRSEEESYDARVKLGELVNAAIEQRRERDSAELLEQLKSAAVAVAPQPPEKELMLLNAPFLVERRRARDFEEAVEEAAQPRAELMHFKLLGPTPAYHFIDLEEPAWA
jgi:Gas vesicle synthesis protein GvpL/GvpF